MGGNHQFDQEGDVAVEKRQQEKIEKPKRYKVIFHNDDYTTMEFVVRVLEMIFRKSPAQATQTMLEIHKKGTGVAGVYTREVAETKRDQTIEWAREEGHPLMLTIEPE
jgi:ATP-dependent Clp protease adaptor protein ClpS